MTEPPETDFFKTFEWFVNRVYSKIDAARAEGEAEGRRKAVEECAQIAGKINASESAGFNAARTVERILALAEPPVDGSGA